MKNFKYKVAICGHFGGTKNFLDGQTIKTKTIYKELSSTYNKNEILCVDTYNWKKNPFKFFIKCIYAHIKSENIIILPAYNGVKILIPLFTYNNMIIKRKIFYVVIGGWLPEFLQNKKGLTKQIKKLNKIFVETNFMKQKLARMGIINVLVMPNFKNIKPIKEKELKQNYKKPYKVCTFSRVSKEKGIEDAIEVVTSINKEANEEIYALDIYGQIDESYKIEFENIMQNFPSYIKYKGCIDSEKSVEILKNYYLLLFPTYYTGEGFAGTLIDAMNSGVPVIASNWRYNSEIIYNGINGYTYETRNNKELKKIMLSFLENQSLYNKMKKNCIKEANKYTSENAIKIMINEIKKN